MSNLVSKSAWLAEYDRIHQGPPGGARKLMEEFPTVDAVLLPCKIGDTVWAIRRRSSCAPCAGEVSEMFFNSNMELVVVVKSVARGPWGEIVFATEEEAWKAIIERRGK